MCCWDAGCEDGLPHFFCFLLGGLEQVRRELLKLPSLVRSTLDVEVGRVRGAALEGRDVRGRLRLAAAEEAVVEAGLAVGRDEQAVRLDEEGVVLLLVLMLLLVVTRVVVVVVVAEDEDEDEEVVVVMGLAVLVLSLRECHTV